MVDFRERLTRAMQHAGMSDKDLLEQLPISAQALRKIYAGTSKSFSAENCALAARALGVDMFWLATGQGEMSAERGEFSYSIEATRPAQVAQENTPSSTAAWSWPFETIDPAKFARLSERQKGMIEGYVRALIDGHNGKEGEGGSSPRAA